MKSSYGTMIIAYYQMQLLFLLAYAGMTHSQVHYITPSSKVPCPGSPCLTLAQFAANSTNYLGNQYDDVTNISLSFLSGNHSLDGQLFLSQADYFSMMQDMESNGTVFIECSASKNQSGRFNISEMMVVVVKNLQFIGCGGNRIIHVEELVVEDTIFQGAEGRDTALMLINVTTACISSSLFHYNNIHVKEFHKNTSNELIFGGALHVAFSNILIESSSFTHNTAVIGGALWVNNSNLHIVRNIYSHNGADNQGGVMAIFNSTANITNSYFTSNVASVAGGAIITIDSHVTIHSNNFTNNSAEYGGVIAKHNLFMDFASINIYNSTFLDNGATLAGGIIMCIGCSTHIGNSTFGYNTGSLYILNSNLTISGCTVFEMCTEPSSKEPTEDPQVIIEEGGAITSVQSTVIIIGKISLSNNQARRGGAILATDSKLMMYGETIITNNNATHSSASGGGGISLQRSQLEIIGKCIASNNYAVKGGGIHATSSTIAVYQPGTLRLVNNVAENGGGFHLEVNSKVNTIKAQRAQINESDEHILVFIDNHASRGGAIYVADETNSGTCLHYSDCFIQTQIRNPNNNMLNTANVLFSGNTASEQGSNLFGGLLDRCISKPIPVIETSLRVRIGVDYLHIISNITASDNTISSLPVRLCFCTSDSEPVDCSSLPPSIKVKKGEAFTVSLVAVDQVDHSVNANISSYLTSHDGGFGEGQQTQPVGRNCTNITFNVFSQLDSETINLYADGPCGNSEFSIRHLEVNFTDCSCPVGFQPLNSETTCECTCDSRLRPANIDNCNITTKSLVRVNTTAWITYINDTDRPGYVIHSHCPFDYCQPPTKTISLNLNDPGGEDKQCANNRRGVLCGACQAKFSLSLGSSRCKTCQGYWPAIFVVILLASIIAGILLVTAILALNITVAVGLINSFIFYANIVGANSDVFFPSTKVHFPIFIEWLNLEIGIDVCFFDGLDTYFKTWLQLVFPTYIISLVIIIIVVSDYSPRFAGLIGKRDPIATLATLILLSYAKLLSVSIVILLPANLDYPDGSQMTVWLLDGTMKYREHKHLALFIMSLLIILIIVVPYTSILLFWQWIVRAPEWKIFKWTRNTKLNAFISVHHAPYNSKYRCWTGLQLLVRVILYITATRTKSDDPEAILLATIVLVGGLLALKTAGVTVYKSLLVDAVDTIINLNILVLSACSIYHFKTDPTKQSIVLHASTIITLILLVGVIAYHIFLLVRKDKCPKEEKEEDDGILLVPVKPANTADSEITHSVIEIPQPRNESPPPQANTDEAEISNTY